MKVQASQRDDEMREKLRLWADNGGAGRYWCSCDKFTVAVEVDDQGIIVATAPMVRRFRGQRFTNLLRWMEGLGGFAASYYDARWGPPRIRYALPGERTPGAAVLRPAGGDDGPRWHAEDLLHGLRPHGE
jgi:hypothetical protein